MTEPKDFYASDLALNTQKGQNIQTTSDLRAQIIRRAKLTLFFLGLLNNSGYVIVLSAAADLANRFKKERLMSLFSGSLVLLSIAVKFLSARFLLKLHHKIRVGIAVSFFFLGLLSIVSALQIESFVLALLGSLFLGMGGSFGDSTIQGFMKAFPPETFIGYSSGTGGAGVFGSFYYLLLKVYGFDVSKIFIFLFPAYILYYVCFSFLIRLKVRLDSSVRVAAVEYDIVEDIEAHVNEELSLSVIGDLVRKLWFYSLNFGLVYFFEYSIFGYLAETSTEKLTGNSFTVKYLFLVIQCAYQIGVFIARSSLQLFKISSIQYLTFIQANLFAMWILFATVLQTSESVLIFTVLAVGLVAGLTYVNTIYMILEDEKILKKEKEVSLNINGMAADFGVICSSLSGFMFKRIVN